MSTFMMVCLLGASTFAWIKTREYQKSGIPELLGDVGGAMKQFDE